MGFEFHPSEWLDIIRHEPVIVVLIGGILGGICLTQTVKKTYLTFQPNLVSDARYRISVYWFAMLSTGILSNYLWFYMSITTGTGLRHVVATIDACAAPYVYQGAKALVATRWPNFAKHWGDDPE